MDRFRTVQVLLILLWTVALSAQNVQKNELLWKHTRGRLAIGPQPDGTQFERIRRALGNHYCERLDPEHRHTQETYARINAGAIVLTPRVCHIEVRGRRKFYMYYVAAGSVAVTSFNDGQYIHDHVSWEEKRWQ